MSGVVSGVPALLEALNALYHHADPAVKDQANKWLEQWQQSPDAWQVCNDVLHSRDLGLEAHYFCAQTLRTKVWLPGWRSAGGGGAGKARLCAT